MPARSAVTSRYSPYSLCAQHPLAASVPAAERLELDRGEAALRGPHEQVAQLLAQPAQPQHLR
ncbi:hypothetical protein, partial [Cellulosimicrobium sp. CUA-896]|uniref:hypothetical protein n=1 Tax=Cellulosimicrobium sp. CUA-896 TaxID=1517881 RepID=UPI002101217D